MKTFFTTGFVAIMFFAFCNCGQTNKKKNVELISYDTAGSNNQNCHMISIIFSTGFNNDPVSVIWNNNIIFNGKITTDETSGIALNSLKIPKTPGIIKVQENDISLADEIDTEYCNMIITKSENVFYLKYSNKNFISDK